MTANAPLSPSACSRCGRTLPTDAPAGLCPRCLLSDGFGNQSEFRSTHRAVAEQRFIPPTIDELADEFPHLEFIRLLGSGGMGAVYLAKQIRLDRPIAVKILPPDLADDPAFAERFLREARALARISHPNIVGVFDFGQSPGGLYYFLMEYIEGPTLRQVVATRSAEPKQALEIVRQVCDALQFAHDKGVVHRDIKPENILLDQRGRVKIADFGLAKLLGLDDPHFGSPAAGSLTGTRQAMGTPHYMAPEQITGSRAVDHRADIYSLGVVFYELLTGELPLGRFAPPSKKVQIDVRLDEVVLRTLESEPAQRYQHASDVKTDVETISFTPNRSPIASLVGASAIRFVRDAGTSAKGAARTMLASPGPGETSRKVIYAILWAAAIPVVLLSIMFYETFERWLDPLAALFAIVGFAAAIPAITAPIGATILGILSVREIRNSNGRITGLVPGFAAAVSFPILLLDLAIWCIGLIPAVLIFNMIGSRDDFFFIALTAIFTIPLMCWVDIRILRAWWPVATEGLSPDLIERELRAIPRPLRTAGAVLFDGFDRFNHELLNLFGKARHPKHPAPTPTDENQSVPHGPPLAQAPLPPERMSLKAIIGACFLLGVPLSIICCIAAVQFQRVDAIELPLWALSIFFAFVPLFATTILGWIAIGDIRASQGRLTGLPLALFDAIFFPLLFLDAIIASISIALTGLVAWRLAEGGTSNTATPVVMIAILFGNLIGLAIIVIVDTLIVRAVWRKIKPQSILRAAEDESSIPPDSETAPPEQESFVRKHRELIAAGAAIGAATLLFAIKATHEGWGPFNPQPGIVTGQTRNTPTAPTQPGLPRAATDEQAQQYLEDTKRRWRIGPSGPELSPGWADNLGIVGATKEEVDQALQAAYADYERMLDAHTTIDFEGDDTVTFRITPIDDDIERITDKVWSDVDPLLNIEQQKLMRYNLPLVHSRRTGSQRWSMDDLILPFSVLSSQTATIRIERSGQWYVYKTSLIPNSQTVPELPRWLRHWQDKYDHLISLQSEGLSVDPTRWPLVAPKPNPSLGAGLTQEGPTANYPEYEHLYRQLAQWKVDPQSIRHIDGVIRMIEFEYEDVLKAHTIQRVENDAVIFEVPPFRDKIAPLERQFWDHVDPLLTVEQQRLMRMNFPVGELPKSTAAIKGDEPTGLIPLGRHGGMTLRIERFGQWYRWDLDLYTEALVKYGLKTFETPSLPHWLRSFQKRYDSLDIK